MFPESLHPHSELLQGWPHSRWRALGIKTILDVAILKVGLSVFYFLKMLQVLKITYNVDQRCYILRQHLQTSAQAVTGCIQGMF